jgi:V/A-type H+-transporting ATPase subunit E
MEIQLDNLIEKIKKDGIEEARQKREEIVNKAKEEAAAIIDEAKKKAEQIINEAEHDAAQFKKTSELALRQAARDTELLVKQRLIDLFDKVFKKQVANVLAPDFLKDLILKLTENWQEDVNSEIIINESDKEKLQDLLLSRLKDELRHPIIIRTSDHFSKGFRIELKDEEVYYDFSDESIADVLKRFLNPKLNELLNNKDG